jgi:hypothetical protein
MVNSSNLLGFPVDFSVSNTVETSFLLQSFPIDFSISNTKIKKDYSYFLLKINFSSHSSVNTIMMTSVLRFLSHINIVCDLLII